MRVLASALALVALAGVAHADDDDDDEDGELKPLPTFSIAISVGGHGTRIGGKSEAGFGPTLELAYGRGRWQYFVEGGFQTAGLREWTAGALEPSTLDGRVLRADLGARWLARQFRPDSAAGIELFLMSTAGVQRFRFVNDARLTRPELAFGFGIQGRMYRKPRIGFRLDARVLFTPNDDEDAVVACHDRCMSEAGASTGFSTGIAFLW